jgi:hypothetical protein
MNEAAPAEKVGARLTSIVREWGLVVLLSLIPALPLLFGSGIVNTRAGGDSPFLLIRLHQLVLNLQNGVFPVRWMPQAAYGLGYPFFNFYAALPYYLAAFFKMAGLGYLWSIKLTQALGFVFASMAMYWFLREQRRTRLASLMASVVYGCAPFHMVNVYVRGDSLSEFYAFVFYPLLLLAFLRLSEDFRVHAVWHAAPTVAIAAVAYAALILTHNLSAFIFTPFLLFYVLLLIFTSTHQRLRIAFASAAALLGGLLLSAWFWIPALAERASVSLEDMTTGYFNFALHFRSADLVQPRLVFDYAITADRNPFSMGFLQALLATLGLAVLAVQWKRNHRLELRDGFAALVLAISTFMMTPWSRPLWQHLPLLPMLQFPWRFLSVQALATTVLCSALIPAKRPLRWVIALIIGIVVLVSALGALRPERLLIHEDEVTAERLLQYEYFTANIGTTIRNDWLPSAVDPRPFVSEATLMAQIKPAPLTLQGQVPSVSLQAQGAVSESWRVDVVSPEALLAFQTYYYPGWRAEVDGRPVLLESLPGLGYIGLRLPQGSHEVHIWLGHTRLRLFAELLSLATASLVLLFWLWRTRSSSLAKHTLIVAFLVSVLWVGAKQLASAGTQTTTLPDARASTDLLDLTMDFDRIPYLHHNPDGILYPDVARFGAYEISSTALQAGDAITITTQWNAVLTQAASAEVSLVSPARHLFGVPFAIASSSQPVSADPVQHILTIPSTTTRGLYLLRIDVSRNGREIRPVDSSGQTLGATYLTTIRIDSSITAPADAVPLALLGDHVHLMSAESFQDSAGWLHVVLAWRTSTALAQNYKVAIRLRDQALWEVGRLDVQPGYGFSPTSLWCPGKLVYDHYLLALDDGTPPGSEYILDITLYESASLEPIGTGSIPHIAVTLPTLRPDAQPEHRLGPSLYLLETQVPRPELHSGEELLVVVKWGASLPPNSDLSCRWHLKDSSGRVVSELTAPLASTYPTSQWPAGCVVTQRYNLLLERELAAGDYSLSFALVEPSGVEVGDYSLPTLVHVTEPDRSYVIPEMQYSVGADFGGQVRLAGYDLLHSEDDLVLTLYWQALSTMSTDYKVFVHLFDPGAEKIASQQDTLVGHALHPTSQWVLTEVVADSITLRLDEVPAGLFTLAVGIYYPQGRLPVVAPSMYVVSSDRLVLQDGIKVR